MIDCPTCKAPLSPKAIVCNSCGWERAKSNGSSGDLESWRCCNEFEGQRCAAPGSLSMSIRGGGPWFCHQHFPLFASHHGHRGPPVESTLATIRALTRRVATVQKPVDFEAQIERLAIESEA